MQSTALQIPRVQHQGHMPAQQQVQPKQATISQAMQLVCATLSN
jgi:hypothetical protein